MNKEIWISGKEKVIRFLHPNKERQLRIAHVPTSTWHITNINTRQATNSNSPIQTPPQLTRPGRVQFRQRRKKLFIKTT